MTLSLADVIFLELSRIEPDARASFLDHRCAGNDALRRDVESLISSLDAPHDDFLDPEQIPTLDMAALDGPLQPGTNLGSFLVLRALGSGGMGVVYAAQQDRPRRTVAIKVLRRGYRHPDILRRFELEAEMLGRLQHPGIAQVYAFYPGDRKTPAHLVMELVSGPPLTDFARAEQLTIHDRVNLIVKLADAVQHAHERGVIHRDLKPANVLVAEGRQPKVLDFGIARATGADVKRLTMETAHGQLMGTLAYMSPEQLRGRSVEIDARSDVYALGILLYRLLTERLPFDVGNLSLPAAIQVVLENAAPPISAVSATLAGPLDHIVAHAMAREVDRRYQTAADLAQDLRRFLDGVHTPSLAPAATPRLADQSVRPEWATRIDGVRVVAAEWRGRLVAVGLSSGSIELREAASGALVAASEGRPSPVISLAFSMDSRLIAAWEDGRVASVAIDAAGTLRDF